MNVEFWRGKRVLVTGHTGFKGSWLALWLNNLSAEVIGYALAPPTQPNLFSLANVSNGIHSIDGDILNLAHSLTPFITNISRTFRWGPRWKSSARWGWRFTT